MWFWDLSILEPYLKEAGMEVSLTRHYSPPWCCDHCRWIPAVLNDVPSIHSGPARDDTNLNRAFESRLLTHSTGRQGPRLCPQVQAMCCAYLPPYKCSYTPGKEVPALLAKRSTIGPWQTSLLTVTPPFLAHSMW